MTYTVRAALEASGQQVASHGIMAKTHPLTFSRRGTIWLVVLFVVVLILSLLALLPIKFPGVTG